MSPVMGQLNRGPFRVVVSGEASRHEEALQKLLGPNVVLTVRAGNPGELLAVIERRQADAAVLDTELGQQELLRTLRMIRRINVTLPVVLVTREVSRWFMEDALRLAAFSVAHKPLEREELLIQLRRIFERFYGG